MSKLGSTSHASAKRVKFEGVEYYAFATTLLPMYKENTFKFSIHIM